ncbi:hypothetical protein [Streptomyces sp. VN1]|uniref:hypothetical protein n=1 Tax=unclassified Streptomyces TaxID=2593676 RepID=UPI001413A884|nr:hypothetical protein [Streptomyces sp. VN1]QIP74760.1 hypothetical protein EZV63_37040 [Streptomyces sp. VN1]
MSTDAYKDFQALQVRRPDDLPPATPLTWQAEKHSQHAERLSNRRLPADFPYEVERGTAGDALAQLALGEAIRRTALNYRPSTLHEALELGATWQEVAAALDCTPDEARDVLRSYADGQRHLYEGDEREGRKPIGFTAEQHRAALALTELADDESAAAEEDR